MRGHEKFVMLIGPGANGKRGVFAGRIGRLPRFLKNVAGVPTVRTFKKQVPTGSPASEKTCNIVHRTKAKASLSQTAELEGGDIPKAILAEPGNRLMTKFKDPIF